ncbi:hypothetical protein GJR96_06720 [Haloferax sp. MBLA0076]|uniref:DUF7344 domain-containing protein n=1 Tax=Haloferax litoreum TaxID=2666140 RepID=A0A6A8GES9_9EURY|nr:MULTISPECIES: hypothetical protein [Haloferax]KAB1193152.1 hypothetical protein Hfx1148_06710 [Haloferax sp. CBA1148]MRX21648.1 hypothetical protein [Haloferax litoreum]
MAVTPSPRLDDAFDALRDIHRRRLLMDLCEGDVTRLGRATTVVADGGDADDERLEVELFHLHLPKLDGAGFITWDRDSGSIERGPRFIEIEPMLRLLDRNAGELPENWV